MNGYKIPLQNGNIPLDYLICESRRDVYSWLLSNGYAQKFPREFHPYLIELEYQNLLKIKQDQAVQNIQDVIRNLSL